MDRWLFLARRPPVPNGPGGAAKTSRAGIGRGQLQLRAGIHADLGQPQHVLVGAVLRAHHRAAADGELVDRLRFLGRDLPKMATAPPARPTLSPPSLSSLLPLF